MFIKQEKGTQHSFSGNHKFFKRFWLLFPLMSGKIWASMAKAGVKGDSAPLEGLENKAPKG